MDAAMAFDQAGPGLAIFLKLRQPVRIEPVADFAKDGPAGRRQI
jgi:hypothetical protein